MNQMKQKSEHQSEQDEYNSCMTLKYKNKVQNGELKIINSKKLTNLEFIQNFKIRKLELIGCRDIIPKLKSSSIQEFTICYSDIIQNFDDIQLENVEILTVQGNEKLKNCSFDRFKQLKHLDISSSYIDISNLNFMLPKLRIQKLRNNQIKDIFTLSNLVNLEELDLSGNEDIDIDPLQSLKQLIKLQLSFCCLQSVQQLSLLSTLVELDVSENKNINLLALQYLVKLKKLDISNTNTNNIDVLQPLYYLEELNISNNEIADINALKYFSNLIAINISQIKAQNIEILLQLKHLKELDLTKNPDIDFQPLQQMVQLQRLNLSLNKLSNISFLSGLINLQHLILSNNQNLDITPLQYLVNLTNLVLSQCKISDISSLRTLINLEVLEIAENEINDIHHLQDLVKLTTLHLQYNCIKNINILKQFKCLKTLYLSRNQGIDLTPLQYLTQLTKLMLNYCDLHEIFALRPLVNLEYLSVSGNQIYYFYPIRDLDADVYVHGNLIVESSDYFTFFKKDISQFNTKQPTKQQMQLAQKMKTVDTTTQCIRDIINKCKHFQLMKQIGKDKLVCLKVKQHEISMSLTSKAVQLFSLLDEHKVCQ
ncbi:Conserved_hypothetical protein [Hexamita inflata]|uniref:Leucine-rich repeat and WD repeat-containing protein 1 LRR domain-containing protein n=1 Tax=Hexamita inflata TaxID=28002 RepID=A0ABP1GSU1_9EUKA